MLGKRWHWLILCLLVVGLANLIRAGVAFAYASSLQQWGTTIPLPWLGVVYAVLGLCFLACAAICWRTRGRCLAVALALFYQGALWLIRIFGDRSLYARGLWGRDLALTGAFLGLIFLLAHRPRRGL